jgi:hypothetical protein
MTHVYECITLRCPYARARKYLRESLEPVAQTNASHALALPPARPGSPQKTMLVRYELGRDPMQFDEPWRVFWTPQGGGPYPDFGGELIVRADQAYSGAVLELHGEYKPPTGIVGKAFDSLMGARVAAATARTLLKHIATQMEERFEGEASAAS